MLKFAKFQQTITPIRCASSNLLKPPDLHKTNWKKDVVYLYQFKRSPILPNLSPYCLKVETFLRANNIKYEPLMSYTVRSKYGKLPFIELNGQQIADSDFILHYLMKYYKIDDGLTNEQRGIARSLDRMLDQSTERTLRYFRIVENIDNFMNPNVSGLPIPNFLMFLFKGRFQRTVLNQLKVEGTGKMKRDDIITILRKDLQALNDILGDKKFLLGIRPTTCDFTTFGHLAATYYLPFRQPVTDLLDDEFPNLKQLIERMRLHYWSDWKRPDDK
uniref:Glutathione S-transferase n=1 Tax=Panagrolaimus sp. JU765 TaxID=591449 RepID=A0AC34QSH7_9BILA